MVLDKTKAYVVVLTRSASVRFSWRNEKKIYTFLLKKKAPYLEHLCIFLYLEIYQLYKGVIYCALIL